MIVVLIFFIPPPPPLSPPITFTENEKQKIPIWESKKEIKKTKLLGHDGLAVSLCVCVLVVVVHDSWNNNNNNTARPCPQLSLPLGGHPICYPGPLKEIRRRADARPM